MSNDSNFDCLDSYSDGWAKGDSAKMMRYMAATFTFSGMPNMVPVDRNSFEAFWSTFQANVGKIVGPGAGGGKFLEMNNVILREVSVLSISDNFRLFDSWGTQWKSQVTGRCHNLEEESICWLQREGKFAGMRLHCKIFIFEYF